MAGGTMNNLSRRLATLEQLQRRLPRPSALLTERQHAHFQALDAATVILLTGGAYDTNLEPALLRGVEQAMEGSDVLSPMRAAPGDRIDAAACRLMNGSDARGPDFARQQIALVTERDADHLHNSLIELVLDCPDLFTRGSDRWTRIGSDGVERYCWPALVGADAPDGRWRGQGFSAAHRYHGG